jgi:hypothetical protein
MVLGDLVVPRNHISNLNSQNILFKNRADVTDSWESIFYTNFSGDLSIKQVKYVSSDVVLYLRIAMVLQGLSVFKFRTS